MRLVLDTNVIVSGLLWDGIEHDLIRFVDKNHVHFFTSLPMLAELNDVLVRPKFTAKIAVSGQSVDQLVTMYARLARIVRPVAMPRVAPDPDDDVVVGTAIAARADYVVTGDRALLTIDPYSGVRLISARAMHELLRST